MINKQDVKVEKMRGSGPGGQNKNKVCSCIRLTHTPTGIQVKKDRRDASINLKMAWKELERRLIENKQKERAIIKKARRDEAIKDETVIRTYNFKNKTVTDHRTKKSASIKEVLIKGNIELLRGENE